MKTIYCTFGDYMVICDQENATFELRCKRQVLAKELCFWKDGRQLGFYESEHQECIECNKLILRYKMCDKLQELVFSVSLEGIEVVSAELLSMTGTAGFGAESVSMSSGEHNFLRAAYGKPVTSLDDMLFRAEQDLALVLTGDCGRRFSYCPEEMVYKIQARVDGQVQFQLVKDLYEKKYGIDYAPINKACTFKKPPVGWMTWYAVKFGASEQTVLENAAWMAKHLKKFGAEAIWVDWEWYHKDFKGVRDDGVDTFHPDPEKYPHGLKYLSDEIRKLGFVPNLWVGFTNDPAENAYIKENPEIVLVQKPEWCGQYFFDFSHPKFLHEFLPIAMKQVDTWGFEGVKFDALPMSLTKHEEHHEAMYDPGLTTREAFRGMIRKTREVLGNDRYLLSCCGCRDSDILWACDLFDAARVGGDIFGWEEFLVQGIGQTARYYPFHNLVFYNDPDNVVIRQEFNTMEQAKSRVAFVSLLGLPITLGDNLPDLPEERVELLRRGIPALDIRPMDVNRMKPGETLVTDLAIATQWDCYHVVSVFNTSESECEEKVSLRELGIEDGEWVAFEYYSAHTEKIWDGVLNVALKPYETKVFAVRALGAVPQVLSTSRHLTQGALELSEICWNPQEKMLCFLAELVEQDPYRVYVYIPEGYEMQGVTVDGKTVDYRWIEEKILCCEYVPENSRKYEFCIR